MEGNVNQNKTMENIMASFAGESQANRKYTAYARKAEAEGNINAARLFRAAADAETIHALRAFEIAGKVKSTRENLVDAKAGETYEFTEMYPEFLQAAQAEGNKDAVRAFKYAMAAEEVHARLYQEALDKIDETEETAYFLCPVCGYIGTEVPDRCPVCGTPGERFIKY